jgi:hypothetical protein
VTNSEALNLLKLWRDDYAVPFCKDRVAYTGIDDDGYTHTLWTDDWLEWHHEGPSAEEQRASTITHDFAIDYDDAPALVKASSSDTAYRDVLCTRRTTFISRCEHPQGCGGLTTTCAN